MPVSGRFTSCCIDLSLKLHVAMPRPLRDYIVPTLPGEFAGDFGSVATKLLAQLPGPLSGTVCEEFS
jgi:hypothetical protein